MVYKEYQNEELSMLGLGLMRLPVVDGDETRINEEEALKMIDYAMEQGITYYDTAWGYHGGNSEPFAGKALSRYPRERFKLASKFPGYDLSNMDKVEEIFEQQLERCRVDYFDFYLFHNVCEMNIDAYLDRSHGIMDYLKKQKEKGRIRHLGFSVHGDYEVTKRFLEAYGEDLEFCQIQLNYIDWTFQAAKDKVELLREYHLPIWVMEPLRGGKLAVLSKEDEAKLKACRPDEGVPAWAFRYLQSIPEVTVILSGMSDFQQLQENIRTFSEEKPLNEEELQVIREIAQGMISAKTLPCTECRYCVSYCPKKLDIPALIRLYNEQVVAGAETIPRRVLIGTPKEKRPYECIGCRSCEAVCPQQIKISEGMADFVKKLQI